MTFGSKANTKIIKVKYLIVVALSPCNAILGRPTLNLLGVVVYTLHLSLNYPLPYGILD